MTDVDQHVARRIESRRRVLGLTLMQVASASGLDYRRIHKYEIGAARMNAEVLWRLAQALSVTPNYFFADLASGRPAEATVAYLPARRLPS